VPRRAALILVLVAGSAAAPVSGCAGSRAGVRHPAVPPAPAVEDLAGFEDALNVYVRLADDHPRRAGYRAQLSRFLVAHGEAAAEQGDLEEVRRSLEHLARLFRPRELARAGRDPTIAALARRYYAAAGQRGDAPAALFGLAFRQHFGAPAERKTAVAAWGRAEHWLVDVSPAAADPVLRHEDLERALDEVAAQVPTPFVVQRARDLYLARYRSARAAVQGGVAGTLERRRAEFSPMLLLRLYLRADAPAEGLRALEALDLDVAARKMVEIVRRATGAQAGAGDLVELAEQFVPEAADAEDLPESYLRQGAAIADNLVRRALAKDPRHAGAHFLRARLLAMDDLVDAAVAEIDDAIAVAPKIEAFWEAGALLRAERVERRADRGSKAGLAALSDLEAFVTRAGSRGLERGDGDLLARAHLAVGEALVREGQPEAAVEHLEAARRGPTAPFALSELGAVYRHLGRARDAMDAYSALRALALSDPMEEAQTEVDALVGLADLADGQGDAEAARRLRSEALAVVNGVLRRWMRDMRSPETAPWGTPEQHAMLFMSRGKLSLLLGLFEQARDDFRTARRLAPAAPEVWADALVELLLAGRRAEALELYRASLARSDLPKDLRLYFSLWVLYLGRAPGAPPPAPAVHYVAHYDRGGWPGKLAAFAAGRLSAEALVEAARTRGERTEAIFYTALARGGDPRPALRKVLGSGLLGFFEYDMARRLLHAAGPPTAARAEPRPGASGRSDLAEPRAP